MSTTLLFVELLIAGIQAVVWLVLLVLSVFGYQWVTALPAAALSDWQALIAVTVLSFVYVLGILFDRLADRVFQKWDRAIGKKIFPNPPYTFGVLRFQLSKENEYLHQQFEYTRSRLRIARASVLNFALITILAEVFVVRWLAWSPDYARLVVFIGVIGILLTALAVYTWNKLVHSYFGIISINYQAILKRGKPEEPVERVEETGPKKEPARKNR